MVDIFPKLHLLTMYEQFIGLVWLIPSNTVNEGNPSTALGLSSVLLCVQQECFHKLYPHNTFFFCTILLVMGPHTEQQVHRTDLSVQSSMSLWL